MSMNRFVTEQYQILDVRGLFLDIVVYSYPDSEQNDTEDTALHSASQFGQSLVVAVLLEVHDVNYLMYESYKD